MTTDFNILFCYDENKIGAKKRAKQFDIKTGKDIEVHLVSKQKVVDVDDDFTHVVIDKTAIDVQMPETVNTEQKLVVTNCHRYQYEMLDKDQIIVNDFKLPYTICRYNLQYQHERDYTYMGPLVHKVEPAKERTERLLVLSGHQHLNELAKYIVENANDVKWTIATHSQEFCQLLKDLNNYDHEIVYTDEIEPLLAKAKYVVHYGSHQLTMECIENDLIQFIIPPLHNRYYFQHAWRAKEFILAAFAYDMFHKIPIERKYQVIRKIRCNFRSYKYNLQQYRKRVSGDSACIPPTTFIQNSKI